MVAHAPGTGLAKPDEPRKNKTDLEFGEPNNMFKISLDKALFRL